MTDKIKFSFDDDGSQASKSTGSSGARRSPATAFTSISDLSRQLDLPAHTLRYWEKEFPTMITPTTGAGGRRYYRSEVVKNIAAIKSYLYAQGYTIDGVKKLIKDDMFDVDTAGVARESKVENRKSRIENRDADDIIELLEQAQEILTR